MSAPLVIGMDENRAINFFYAGLKCERGEEEMSDTVLLHTASVLASFALTSRFGPDGFPVPANLSEVHDTFVLDHRWYNDLLAQVTAGASIILLAGFLRNKKGGRYNIDYFEWLGQGFYNRASALSSDVKSRELFGYLAEELPEVTDLCHNFHQSLRYKRYIIDLKPPN
jgi:hypothetical protein